MAAKLTPEEWKKVGELYVANTPVLRISKQFGVARISIERAAKRFGWMKIPRADIEQVVQAKVHGGHLSTDPEAKAEFIEKVADERAILIRRHQAEWKQVAKLRGDAYAVLSGQRTQVIAINYETATTLEMKERVHLASKLVAMYEADTRALNGLQEGERRAHGFDYRAQQATDTKDERAERERKRLMASLIQTANAIKAMQTQNQTESA